MTKDWEEIENAVKRIQDNEITKWVCETKDGSIQVYRVGTVIRIDIKVSK